MASSLARCHRVYSHNQMGSLVGKHRLPGRLASHLRCRCWIIRTEHHLRGQDSSSHLALASSNLRLLSSCPRVSSAQIQTRQCSLVPVPLRSTLLCRKSPSFWPLHQENNLGPRAHLLSTSDSLFPCRRLVPYMDMRKSNRTSLRPPAHSHRLPLRLMPLHGNQFSLRQRRRPSSLEPDLFLTAPSMGRDRRLFHLKFSRLLAPKALLPPEFLLLIRQGDRARPSHNHCPEPILRCSLRGRPYNNLPREVQGIAFPSQCLFLCRLLHLNRQLTSRRTCCIPRFSSHLFGQPLITSNVLKLHPAKGKGSQPCSRCPGYHLMDQQQVQVQHPSLCKQINSRRQAEPR